MTRDEAMALWVKALRSGEYQQTYTKLARFTPELGFGPAGRDKPAGYCCLGVACDLFADELGLKRTELDGYWMFGSYATAFLPQEIVIFLDLNSDDPKLPFKDSTNDLPVRLADLNDSRQFSFNQIADLIEAFL